MAAAVAFLSCGGAQRGAASAAATHTFHHGRGRGLGGGRRSLLPRCSAGRRPQPISADADDDDNEMSTILDPSASPFQILGLDSSSSYSAAQLKAAFRARVKEFHPDVSKDTRNADLIMKRVIEAYEMLSAKQVMMAERNSVDPFEEPECEACDLFVNEILCIGKGCPYSCVKRAPHAFAFVDEIGTARAISQGHGDDYLIQLAVGQCPRRCIYNVTPGQRAILEDILASVLRAPYDLAEAAMLDSLISKARFENNRFKKPKRETKASTDCVDWL